MPDLVIHQRSDRSPLDHKWLLQRRTFDNKQQNIHRFRLNMFLCLDVVLLDIVFVPISPEKKRNDQRAEMHCLAIHNKHRTILIRSRNVLLTIETKRGKATRAAQNGI